ncbi:MAG TPA: PQQ-binding-like beta-propeller repeat protein [Actinomycetota bacterium]|nr:PQQ-binding-like beta-propeller repeat protein [Actinomycetota bacterium]
MRTIRAFVALALLLTATPAIAGHQASEGELATRWTRHGFNEAWELATSDLDGDGHTEIVYGGRKLAIVDEQSLRRGPAARTIAWNHEDTNQLDGGDNVWTTGIELVGDGTAYVTTSDTDAYKIDLNTGDKQWHDPRTGAWFSNGLAVFDAPGDSIPDVFPTGGTRALSGADGSILWEGILPRLSKFATGAQLDGDPARELIVAADPSGVAIGQPTLFGVDGNGSILWSFVPNSIVESLTAGDVDGDGLNEAIVGTATGYIYVVGSDGSLLWAAFPGLGVVENVVATNNDGDPGDEVFATYHTPLADAPAFSVLGYDNSGAQLWRHIVDQLPSSLRAAELDEDPEPELLVGMGTHLQLDTSGAALALETGVDDLVREKWRVETAQQVMSFDVARIGGERAVLVGSADAVLRGVKPGTGELSWQWSAGGYTFSVATGDVDGDGVDEIAKSGTDGVLVLSDSTGRELWSRRIASGNNGIVRGLDMGDANGDGEDEIAVAGTSFSSEEAGVVELYEGDGTRLWTNSFFGGSEEVEIADLDRSGTAEVVASEQEGLDGECALNTYSYDGTPVWRTPVSNCLVVTLDTGNMDADPELEIAYGDRTLASQPHLALLEHDGSITWNLGITDQVFWVEAIEGGMVHGGFGQGQLGAITRRDAQGGITWRTMLPDDPQFRSASRFATLIPNDSGFDIAATADDGAVYRLAGGDGAIAWGTRLEPNDIRFQDRHQSGPVVYIPPQGDRDARLVTGQYRTGRRRAQSFALTLDGAIVGSAPMEGEAQAIAPVRYADGVIGAIVGAGLAIYAFDACPGCSGAEEATPTSLALAVTGQQPRLVLAATLTETAAGQPVADQPVEFYSGDTLLGTARSGADGVAVIEVPPRYGGGKRTFRAVFHGSDTYVSSEATASS